jgi:hypothetical protein
MGRHRGLGMADIETRNARTATIMLTGVAVLLLAAIVDLRPMPGDCAVSPNGVVDCGPPRDVTVPLVLAAFGCAVFAVGGLYLLRIRASIRTPSREQRGLSPAATKRPKGFRARWRLPTLSSVAAVPVQMTSMGGVVMAFGLLLAWASPGTLFVPIGLLLLGALGVYGGLRRIQEDRHTWVRAAAPKICPPSHL